MMARITHEIRHILRAQNDENAMRITAIYDAEHENVTFSGSGGKLSVDQGDLEGLEALIKLAIALRDKGGWSTGVEVE